MIANTEGIVLKSIKYGETSKIASVFTKDFGRISVLAKGARKPKNKFGSSLDVLSISEIYFYNKPNRDLHLLSKSELKQPLRRIYDSFDCLSAGLIAAEAISQTQDINEVNSDLYNIFANILFHLNNNQKNPFAILSFFQIKLAHILGFAIDFNFKNSLKSKNNKLIFSFETGNFINPHSINSQNIYRIDIKIAEILNKIPTKELSEIVNISISKNNILQILDFFVKYFSFHLEKHFQYRTLNLFNSYPY